MKKKFLFILSIFLLYTVVFALDMQYINVTNNKCSVHLNWENYENPDNLDYQYVIFRSTDLNELTDEQFLGNIENAIGITNDTSYDDVFDSQNDHGKKYYYRVGVFVSNKRILDYLTEISDLVTVDCRLDATISNFYVQSSDKSSILLKWEYSGEQSDISYAEVYYDTDQSFSNKKLYKSNIPPINKSLLINNLSPGVEYFFQLIIYDKVGFSDTAVVSGKTQSNIPSVSSFTAKSKKGGVIELSWIYSNDNRKLIKEFIIFRSLESYPATDNNSVILHANKDASSFTDNTIPGEVLDTIYYYQIVPVSIYDDTVFVPSAITYGRSDRKPPEKPSFDKEDWGYVKGIDDTVTWSDISKTEDPVVYFIGWNSSDNLSYINDLTLKNETKAVFETKSGRIRFVLWAEDSLGNPSDTVYSFVINDILAPTTTLNCNADNVYSVGFNVNFVTEDKVDVNIDSIPGSGIKKSILKYQIFSTDNQLIKEDSVINVKNGNFINVYNLSNMDSCFFAYGIYSIDNVGNIEEFAGYKCGPYKFINTKPAKVALLKPSNNECINNSIIIKWQQQPNILEYEVHISITDDFTSPDIKKVDGTVDSILYSPSEDNLFYYIKVRAKNNLDFGDFSDPVKIFYDNTVPHITSIEVASPDTSYAKAEDISSFKVIFDDSVDVNGLIIQLLNADILGGNNALIDYSLDKNSGLSNIINIIPKNGFTEHTMYKISISNIQDCAGNVDDNQYDYFLYTYYNDNNGGEIYFYPENGYQLSLNLQPTSLRPVEQQPFYAIIRTNIYTNPNIDNSKLIASDIENISSIQLLNTIELKFSDMDNNLLSGTELLQPINAKIDLNSPLLEVNEDEMIYVFKYDDKIDVYKICPVNRDNDNVKFVINSLSDKFLVGKLKLPKKAGFAHNYPNPFNPLKENTKIRFTLNKSSNVTINIYDFFGHHVRTLECGSLNIGINEVVWDGKNGDGQIVADGAYLGIIDCGNATLKVKIAVLKK